MGNAELFAIQWQDLWGERGEHEPLGAVFTLPRIVDLILDLSGYVPEAGPLSRRRLLEPGCGDGAFLDAIVQRLIRSEQQGGAVDWTAPSLENAIRAVDVSASSLGSARALLLGRLREAGCPAARAAELADRWTLHADFLLHPWDEQFDVVVGNPPYVRLEEVPKPLLEQYRSRFSTVTDRADLYVAFIERGLGLLRPNGVLAYICANRFAKNQYGANLRRHIADHFHVRHFINLEHTNPFVEPVSAYPAIIVIDRERNEPTRAATLHDLSDATLGALRDEIADSGGDGRLVSGFPEWYPDGSPWLTTSRAEHDFLAELERRFPTLEASGPGTRVGIGVATGADAVFVLDRKHPEIEESRQIPLLVAEDVRVEGPNWSGHYLVNPFSDHDDGSLVDLADYPGLRSYLEEAEDALRRRHVARNRPARWYRTIDRVWPGLQRLPKLLLPDIQAGGVVALDPGDYYPHHNLYWIASASWDLLALQALLRSSHVLAQVRALSVQMRGGSVRYQAQTLRRLRVPSIARLSPARLERLRAVARATDQELLDAVVGEVLEVDVPAGVPGAGS
jgi:methylase of polypeptide subunit release factors